MPVSEDVKIDSCRDWRAAHRRVDEGRYDLDHVERRVLQLMTQSEREGVQGRFAEAIGRHGRGGRKGQARRNVDDRPEGRFRQMRSQQHRELHRGFKIGGQFQPMRRPVLRLQQRRMAVSGAGVVHKDVQPREARQDLIGQGRSARFGGHVALHRLEGWRVRLRRRQRPGAASADNDVIAARGEPFGEGKADAGAPAGDEDGVAGHPHRSSPDCGRI